MTLEGLFINDVPYIEGVYYTNNQNQFEGFRLEKLQEYSSYCKRGHKMLNNSLIGFSRNFV